MMIIFHTPPPFLSVHSTCCTVWMYNHARPNTIMLCFITSICRCVHDSVSLRCSSCAYICFWPQRDLLLHVDWGGRQQEVWVLQAPAGKPLFNSLFAPRWAPVCCDRRFYLNTRCSFLWRCWCDRVLCPKRKEIAKNNNVKNKTWKTKQGVKRLKK